MDDKANRTDGKPIFDTDRAWERFERTASGEQAPAFWSQTKPDRGSDGQSIVAKSGLDRENLKEEGVAQMRNNASIQGSQEVPGASPTRIASSVGANERFRPDDASRTEDPAKRGLRRRSADAWRTERPAKRRLRRWSISVVAAAMAVCLLASPWGDRTLAAMLHTFRVQHVVGLGISPDDMAAISSLLERGSPDGDRRFDLAQYGTLTQSGGGESQTITWQEAEKRMGAHLLRLDGPEAPSYQPAATLTFRLNVKAVNRLLTRLGSSTDLPAEADGKAITLHIPDGIAAEGMLAGKPAHLLQYGKPELSVEGGIDASVVREAILGLPVLPDSLRTKLAAIDDWQSTLPVPAREGETESLRLGGRDAIMTASDAKRFLLWLDGDRMSLLSADTADFPDASAFRLAAEALVQR